MLCYLTSINLSINIVNTANFSKHIAVAKAFFAIIGIFFEQFEKSADLRITKLSHLDFMKKIASIINFLEAIHSIDRVCSVLQNFFFAEATIS